MGLKAPDNRVFAAMHRLKHVPEFQEFTGWLEQALAEKDRENRRQQGEMVYRGQGEALAVEDILNRIENSTDVLKKQNSR